MVIAPVDVQRSAAQARVRLIGVDTPGDGFSQAVALGERVALGEPLERSDLLNLRSVLARDAESPELAAVQELLGGVSCRDWLFRSDLPERPLRRLSDRLSALEDRTLERILGMLEAVFVAAVGKTAVRVAKHVKSARPKGCPVEWLSGLPDPVRRAAISDTEESEVLGTVADVDGLLRAILFAASVELAGILRAELGLGVEPERLLPGEDSAADVAVRAMSALILGRLSRNDSETSVQVPRNIARDVLHAAGGADTTPAGGVVKSDMGRVLVAGVETPGDGFATSQRVVDVIAEEGDDGQRVEAVRRWKHSGARDSVPAHRANDGKRDVDCDFSAGPPGALRNCGCRWVTELEVVA